MNSEIMKELNIQRVRLKAVTAKFLATKEPLESFHMMMQHTFAMRADMDALKECLSKTKRVDEQIYFATLIKYMNEYIDMLLAGMPGVTCDENGVIRGGSVITRVRGQN